VAQEPPYKFETTVVALGTSVVIPGGLRGEIYYIKPGVSRLPDLRRLQPVGTIYTQSLNVPPQDFQVGFPGITERFEWFAVDYTGRFWVSKPGKYQFSLTSDDGARLWIDGHEIVNNDGVHSTQEKNGSRSLKVGIHRIRVAYFQGPRFHVALVLGVARPDEEVRIFHVDQFKPPPGVELPDSR